jgi:tetratricopeptide (TPR) repeat protein
MKESAKAVDAARRILATNPADPELRFRLADTLGTHGSRIHLGGALNGALQNFVEQLRLLEQLVREHPENAAYRRALMLAHSHLGDVLGNPNYLNASDPAGAHAHYDKMLEIAESLAAADRANKTAQMDLAQAHLRVGAVLEAGLPREALTHFETAHDLLTARAGGSTGNIQNTLAFAETRIGTVLTAQGQLAEGITHLRKAIVIKRSVFQLQESDGALVQLVISMGPLANALARSHDRPALDLLVAEASPLLERCRTIPMSIYGRCPVALGNFGEAYAVLKDGAEACKWFRRSIDAWREIETAYTLYPSQRASQAVAARHLAACPMTR